MAKASNELIVVEKIAAPELFTSAERVETLLKSVEDQVLAVPSDVTTEKGRSAIASLAHKVARSKTALEEIGKEFAGVVADSRRTIKDRLDALKAKVRQPLTDWEFADEKRRDVHEAAMQEIAENAVFSSSTPNSRVIQARIDWLSELPKRDWEEFSERAEELIKAAGQALLISLAAAVHRGTEQAELARLRQEAAARAEQERVERERVASEAKAAKEAEERSLKAQVYVGTTIASKPGTVEDDPAATPVAIYSEPFEAERVTIPLTSPGDAALVDADSAWADHQMLVRSAIVGGLVSLASINPNDAETIVAIIAADKIPNVRIIY